MESSELQKALESIELDTLRALRNGTLGRGDKVLCEAMLVVLGKLSVKLGLTTLVAPSLIPEVSDSEKVLGDPED